MKAAWALKPVNEVKNPGKLAGRDSLRRFSVPLLLTGQVHLCYLVQSYARPAFLALTGLSSLAPPTA